MYMYIYRVHQPDKPMVSVGETNSQLAARLFQLKGNKNSALSSDCMTIMGMSDASWQMLKGISESLGRGPSSDKTSGEGFQEGLIIQYHSCMILWFCYCTHCCALCRQNLNINHGDVGPASCGKKTVWFTCDADAGECWEPSPIFTCQGFQFLACHWGTKWHTSTFKCVVLLCVGFLP